MIPKTFHPIRVTVVCRPSLLVCLALLTAVPVLAVPDNDVSAESAVGATKADATVQARARSAGDALAMREEMVRNLIQGSESAAAALKRLKAHRAPRGIGAADAQLGHAAIDVGQRLLVLGKETDAVIFFEEAERVFTKLADKTPDTETALKTEYLAALALVRARYLGKTAEADANLETAEALQPDNEEPGRVRRSLGREKQNSPTNSTHKE